MQLVETGGLLLVLHHHVLHRALQNKGKRPGHYINFARQLPIQPDGGCRPFALHSAS